MPRRVARGLLFGLAVASLVSLSISTKESQPHTEQHRHPGAPEGSENQRLHSIVKGVTDDNTVILTQTSCGYLRFAANWVLHMQQLGKSNWLVIVEDLHSLQFIEDRYPGHAIAASEFTGLPLNGTSEMHDYGTDAFAKLACMRPVYMQTILDYGISVVWSDSDSVWLQDFMKEAPRDLDYVGVDDSEELEQDTGDACTCLMYLNPTDTAKHLMHEWRHVCIVTNGNNQPAWNAVFSRERRRAMTYHIMPHMAFPNGLITEKVLARDPKYAAQVAEMGLDPADFKPTWIHANFRIGFDAKRAFLKDTKRWIVQREDDFPDCSTAPGASTSRHF